MTRYGYLRALRSCCSRDRRLAVWREQTTNTAGTL